MKKDYMSIIKTVQNTQLEILKSFHDFCVANDIKYMLAYGTLLGSLRHKGFIPWDDDIDLVMTRPEYDKFLALSQNLNANLYVQNFLSDNSYFPFTKLRLNDTKMIMKSSYDGKFHQGVWIDIFPLDEMPKEGTLHFKLRYLYIANLIAIITSNSYSKVKASKMGFNRIIRTVYFIINKIFGDKLFKKLLSKALTKKFGDSNHKLYDLTNATISNSYGMFSIDKDSANTIVRNQFESYEFYVPESADTILKEVYGDYMTPPPLDKQYPHHKVVCFQIGEEVLYSENI